jgi:hypothetical protein
MFNSTISAARLSFILIVFISFGLPQSANGRDAEPGNGGRVGNGGDWRKIMLGMAQNEAANWTNSAALNTDLFDQDTALAKDSVAYKFLTRAERLRSLATDIIASDHIYRDNSNSPRREYTTCAWTNDPTTAKLTDIVFSLDLCEGGFRDGGQSFVNRLLIHESVHHILVEQSIRDAIGANFSGSQEQKDRKEDQLCDEIALAIHRAFELVVRMGKSHWRDIETPIFKVEHDDRVFQSRGFHVTAWTGLTENPKTKNRMIIWGGCHEGEQTLYACGGDKYLDGGAIYSPDDGTWTTISSIDAPSKRAEAESAWSGSDAEDSMKNRLLIWGGCTTGDGCETRLNDGGIYDPANDRWTSIKSSSDSPAPRVHHSVVWTGSELIIWGGHPSNAQSSTIATPLKDGGIYNPKNGQWRAIRSDLPNTPLARGYHTAIWTGETGNSETSNKMLLLGGCLQEIADACSKIFDDGALFDPKTMTWKKLVTSGQPYVARHNGTHLFVPSQSKVYIFGGFDSNSNVIAAAQFLDLKTMMIHNGAAMTEGRFKHRAVWAGDKMMIFGGKLYNTSTRNYELASSVVALIPGTPGTSSPGQWITYQTNEMVPLRTIEHSAIWTGNSLLVWGGQIFDRGFTNTGSQFFPGLNPR